MELTNDFVVGVPVEQAWEVLTDVERIAPCMPGAQLQEIEGDEYRGIVKVKVGPITAQYAGKALFVERDEEQHRAVLRAEGRETRGQGNANATITATLEPDGDGTHVAVVTDLTVTGRVAQFGRGVLADVSAKLLGQFVDCLETSVLAAGGEVAAAAEGASEGDVEQGSSNTSAETVADGEAGDAATRTSAAEGSAGARRIDSPDPAPVDLIGTAGAPVAKRIAPILFLVALGWLVRILIRRRRR
jgi:carbon monoxide dehydrogenase subunit G